MNRRQVLWLGLGALLGACTENKSSTPTAGSEEPGSGSSSTKTGEDQIDPSTVVWLHTDVSGWAQTSTVTDVGITDSSICISHTMSGKWPRLNGGEGNPWIFVNLNGTWHAATYEWLRPGQVCKAVTRSGSTSVGRHTKAGPLMHWVPGRGEQIGLMVTTPARSHTRTSNERSNIHLANWP